MKASVVFVSALLLSAAGASAQTNPGINDAQIASIVVTANQVDIDAGKQRRGQEVRAAHGH